MDTIVDALQSQGAIIENIAWLKDGIAADIFFAVLPIDEARQLLAQLLAYVPLDFSVQRVANRAKKLLISDMDSTIIQQECIDELAGFAGIKPQISAITERAMNGELDFEAALIERVALLKDLPESVLQQTFEEKIILMDGAVELVKTMKESGATAVLVSGGFTFFTEKIAAILGFDGHEANTLEIKDGLLTGNVLKPPSNSQTKLDSLLFHSQKLNLTLHETLAIGDGANDLPMIQACLKGGGMGVGYHPKPHVAEIIKQSGGIIIKHTNLKSLIYMQGLPE